MLIAACAAPLDLQVEYEEESDVDESEVESDALVISIFTLVEL